MMSARTVKAARAHLVSEVRDSRFAICGLLCALAILVAGQWYLHLDGWSGIAATDVRVYAEGGRWALQRADMYSATFPSGFTGHLPFTYPPFGAIAMIPLGLLPDSWLVPIWTLASLASLVGILLVSFGTLLARLHGRWRAGSTLIALLLIVPTGPISELLPFGQIGAILTLACLLDVTGRTGPFPQGVLVGVMTAVKLTPGLFILHWVSTRQWRPALTASITVAVCWSIAAMWLPNATRTYVWTERLILNPTARAARPDLMYNQSMGGLLARLNGGDIPLLWYVPLAALLCAAGLAVGILSYRVHAPVTTAAAVGLTSVLVSPVSWNHHAVWLVPAMGAILSDGRSARRVVAAAILLGASYYPIRNWLPLESTLGFHEYWFTLYCATLVLLAVLSWRAQAVRVNVHSNG